MLAKMWKKVLLATCIIACIFNLMSKLVNRHSLESNLKRANDGNTVLDALKIDEPVEEKNVIENENLNDNIIEQNNIDEQTENDKSGENDSNVSENKENEDDMNIMDLFKKDEITEEKQDQDKEFKYTDFTIVF